MLQGLGVKGLQLKMFVGNGLCGDLEANLSAMKYLVVAAKPLQSKPKDCFHDLAKNRTESNCMHLKPYTPKPPKPMLQPGGRFQLKLRVNSTLSQEGVRTHKD